MKTITLILTIAFVFIITGSVNAGDDNEAAINVPTIQCGMCKKNISTALEKVDGVKKVQVDLKKKRVVITYDDSLTNLNSLENAITSAGYDANDKEADPDAYKKLHECCKVPGKP